MPSVAWGWQLLLFWVSVDNITGYDSVVSSAGQRMALPNWGHPWSSYVRALFEKRWPGRLWALQMLAVFYVWSVFYHGLTYDWVRWQTEKKNLKIKPERSVLLLLIWVRFRCEQSKQSRAGAGTLHLGDARKPRPLYLSPASLSSTHAFSLRPQASSSDFSRWHVPFKTRGSRYGKGPFFEHTFWKFNTAASCCALIVTYKTHAGP